MNVLKALNEDRFNKVLINVNSITIINPCEIEIISSSIAHKVRHTNGVNQLPFQCILNGRNAKMILSGIQNIVIQSPRVDYRRIMRSHIFSHQYYNERKCRISFYKELTVEQINTLVVLFNTEADSFITEYISDFN